MLTNKKQKQKTLKEPNKEPNKALNKIKDEEKNDHTRIRLDQHQTSNQINN